MLLLRKDPTPMTGHVDDFFETVAPDGIKPARADLMDVMRTDDNGNDFVMYPHVVSGPHWDRWIEYMNSGHHKQHYWLRRVGD